MESEGEELLRSFFTHFSEAVTLKNVLTAISQDIADIFLEQ
jgi:hypothetical protein